MPGFTDLRWTAINATLDANPERFGLPTRRNKPVLLGSFNALKLSKRSNSAKQWDFLTKVCSSFDLLAVQEVMDDVSGIRRLHESLGSGFQLLLSDATGAFPNGRGLRERLAYLYRPARIELKELVSDITYDRSVVAQRLKNDIDLWAKFFADFANENELRVQQGKRRKSLGRVALPKFLTFIRTPHCGSFSVRARNGADAIEFFAVNAHLLFGNKKGERTREFFALIEWLVERTKARDRLYFKNMILLGDLNLDFKNPQSKLSDVIRRLHDIENEELAGKAATRVNFPFLDVHPKQQQLFTTNARKSETFDHIAFFIVGHEKNLPTTDRNLAAGTNTVNSYNYGVFDFVELFSQAVHKKPFDELKKTQRNSLLRRANKDISDHMPI